MVFFYRGREGMWSWLLHRVAGVSIVVFLIAHILDTSLAAFGPKWFNHAMALYRKPVFRVGEVMVAAAVFFHALNGIRISIIDFAANATRAQRQMFYVVAAAFLIVIVPMAYAMLSPVFGAGR